MQEGALPLLELPHLSTRWLRGCGVQSADSIVHRYGDTPVLRASAIELQADEQCALVGPSESGKIPLLNVLADILRPSAQR
jgi:ABC-type taurine transport system ATPase subunit